MVSEAQAQFSVQPLPTLPISGNFVLQSASRLLLNSFDWIRSSNSAFKLLDLNVQIVLLQKSWFELFALGMSQCAKTLSLTTIVTNINLQIQANLAQGKISQRKFALINEQLFYLQNFITDCERLNISPLEYAYLKLISIFDCGRIFFNCLF